MNTRIRLLLICESADGKKALPLAHVDDPDLLVGAARKAIDKKREEAAELAAVDFNLGTLATAEALSLERSLAVLIPGLLPMSSTSIV